MKFIYDTWCESHHICTVYIVIEGDTDQKMAFISPNDGLIAYGHAFLDEANKWHVDMKTGSQRIVCTPLEKILDKRLTMFAKKNYRDCEISIENILPKFDYTKTF